MYFVNLSKSSVIKQLLKPLDVSYEKKIALLIIIFILYFSANHKIRLMNFVNYFLKLVNTVNKCNLKICNILLQRIINITILTMSYFQVNFKKNSQISIGVIIHGIEKTFCKM